MGTLLLDADYRDPDLRYQRVLTQLEQAEQEANAIGEMIASQGTTSNPAAPKVSSNCGF